ncbi:expressed unknown protein [Seminavis robusta]|uniref:Uncharacterized protein n=1 Tax=Seminavis robusta TaxID=568900 RepID=A0A9N8HFE6_9STRA|nr:expressed unknown protein [Seminavis robusta]|eukprot:Sro432_g141640.1 n/a (1082) ;mRNA; f:29456-32701
MVRDQAKRALSNVACECQRRAKRARITLRKRLRDLEEMEELYVRPTVRDLKERFLGSVRSGWEHAIATDEPDFVVTNLPLILSMPLHHQDCLGSSLALEVMVKAEGYPGRTLTPEQPQNEEEIIVEYLHEEFGTVGGNASNQTEAMLRNQSLNGSNGDSSLGKTASSTRRIRLARMETSNTAGKPPWVDKFERFQQILQDNVDLFRVQQIQVSKPELDRVQQFLVEKLEVERWHQVVKDKSREIQGNLAKLQGVIRKTFLQDDSVSHHASTNSSHVLEDFNSTSTLGENAPPRHDIDWTNQTVNSRTPTLIRHDSLTLQEPWMKPTVLMSNQGYLFLHWVERTSAILVVAVFLHAVWLILRKPRHRKRLLRLLLDQDKKSPSSPTYSLTNELVEMKMNGGDCPESPLLPETVISTSSTNSPAIELRLRDLGASAAIVNGQNNNWKHMDELYRRKENECLALERKVQEITDELTRLQLEQPKLDSMKQTETQMIKIQKLNSDLQELIEGKDLQLLNFSTQVQQLNKDLAARESQLSNILNLYSDQKEELEKQKEEAARRHNHAMEYNSSKLQEMNEQLKESNEHGESLTERLAEVSDELAEQREKESMLRRQLDAQSSRARELEIKSVEQEDAEKELKGRLDDQASRCRDLSGELRQQVKSQRILQEQLDDQIKRARKLEDQLQHRAVAESKFQEQLGSQVSRSRQLEEQLQQHSIEQRNLQQKADNQMKKCKTLEEQLEQEREVRGELEKQLARHALELEKSRQLNAHQTVELKQSRLEITRQTQELEKNQQELVSLCSSENDALTDSSAADSVSELQRLQNEHMQLKSSLLDHADKCDLLHKQVEQQKKLQAKQQDRNKILLETNQTLTEMIDERQKRCGELEKTVEELSRQLSKYQKRQGDEASKLEELRTLRREKQEIAQTLLTTQRRHSQEGQLTAAKLAIDLEQQQDLVASLKTELESAEKRCSQRMMEMQRRHEEEQKEKEAEFRRKEKDLKQLLEVQDEQTKGLLLQREDSSSSIVTDVVVETHPEDPLLGSGGQQKTAVEPSTKEGSNDGPDLDDLLSSEVSFLLGLQRPRAR